MQEKDEVEEKDKKEDEEGKKKMKRNFLRSHLFVWERQRVNEMFPKCVNDQVLRFL